MADRPRQAGVAATGRSFTVAFALLVAVCVLLAASSPAAGTPRHASAAVASMSVHFAFNTDTKALSDVGVPLYAYAGSGTMKLADTPPANVHTLAEYGTSTIVIRHTGSSATFKVFSTGYRYAYRFEKGGSLLQVVRLNGDITRSTIRACRVGSSGYLDMDVDSAHPSEGSVLAVVCGGPVRSFGSVRIVPTPKPALLPSLLTLTVNGLACTATVGKSCYRPGNGGDAVVAGANSSLSIKAEADHPMPKGWRLELRRTGDPLSAGNGSYYLVCMTTTEDLCEATRPGLPAGSNGDFVYATVSGPTGGPILLAQTGVEWK